MRNSFLLIIIITSHLFAFKVIEPQIYPINKDSISSIDIGKELVLRFQCDSIMVQTKSSVLRLPIHHTVQFKRDLQRYEIDMFVDSIANGKQSSFKFYLKSISDSALFLSSNCGDFSVSKKDVSSVWILPPMSKQASKSIRRHVWGTLGSIILGGALIYVPVAIVVSHE